MSQRFSLSSKATMVDVLVKVGSRLLLLLLLIAVVPRTVVGTWSIVAIDKTTQQMGAALATCIDKDTFPEVDITSTFITVPCKGGIIAQALTQDETGPAATIGKPLLQSIGMNNNNTAQDIVIAMNDGDLKDTEYFNSQMELISEKDVRQYGVVTYTSSVAAYTGSQLTELYQSFNIFNTEETFQTFHTDQYIGSVQGNVVFPGTVAATAHEFVSNSQGSCDFIERLLRSLRQGYSFNANATATGGGAGGDVRCQDYPASEGALLAYLKVMGSDGKEQINIQVFVGSSEQMSALSQLETLYKEWRNEHPCRTFDTVPGTCTDDDNNNNNNVTDGEDMPSTNTNETDLPTTNTNATDLPSTTNTETDASPTTTSIPSSGSTMANHYCWSWLFLFMIYTTH